MPVGVFPGVDHDTAAIETSRVFGEMLALNPEPHEEHKNYKSFAEEAAAADEDLERIVSEGFAEKFESAAAVVQRFGDFIPAKVAVQAELRKDGSKKIRLIVDMRRSGTNGRITLRERLVLPRMSDYAESVLDLLEEHLGEHMKEFSTELFVIDFSDAFYTMHLAEEDRKHVVIKGTRSWFVFKCVAFGLACGPVLWGRLAAAGGRLAQAVFAPTELRFQTYVDDPAGAVWARTREERTILITIFLLTFQVMGFKFSWKKGQRGRKVDWIGGEFAIEPGMLTTKLTEERAQRLKDTLETLDESKGMVATKVVIKAASVAAAAASVVPRARPFVAHLWGAAFHAKRRPFIKDQGREVGPRTLCSLEGAVTQLRGWEHCWRAAQAVVDTGITDGSCGHHPHGRLAVRHGRRPPFCAASTTALLGGPPRPAGLRALRGQARGPSMASSVGAPCSADKPARLQEAPAPQVVHCDRGG